MSRIEIPSTTESMLDDILKRLSAEEKRRRLPNLSDLEGVVSDIVTAGQNTTSATYTDLSTVGPTVSFKKTGSGRALVFLTAMITNTLGDASFMSYELVDPNAVVVRAADDAYAAIGGQTLTAGVLIQEEDLDVEGNYTITAKYRRNSGTATFTYRRIMVVPL